MITTHPTEADVKARLVLLRMARRLVESGGDHRPLVKGAAHAAHDAAARGRLFADYLLHARAAEVARENAVRAEAALAAVADSLLYGPGFDGADGADVTRTLKAVS